MITAMRSLSDLFNRKKEKSFSCKITDDSGILALIDPDAYEGFVDADWSIEAIKAHFMAQAARSRLVLWGTGAEWVWPVEVRFARSNVQGFREFESSIESSKGRLLVTSFDSLSMAATYPDVTLPEPACRDDVFTVPPGRYRCRVIQHLDPDGDLPDEGLGFAIEVFPDKTSNEAGALFWSPFDPGA